jgi:hypothetical protein
MRKINIHKVEDGTEELRKLHKEELHNLNLSRIKVKNEMGWTCSIHYSYAYRMFTQKPGGI